MPRPSAHRWPRLLPLLLGAGLVSGCAALPVLQHLPRGNQTEVSPPGEDGTRYLAVEGGPLSSRRALRTRWNATARRVCEGDFQRLAESSVSRKANGVTRSRIHEGYIQCLLPGEAEPDEDGPTVDEAMAKDEPPPRPPPRLGRR